MGPYKVQHALALAPMAGNTNLAYRRLCRKYGAEITTTEMVSAQALHHGDTKTQAILERGDDEFPVAAQLFGSDPTILANGARIVEELGFHLVDFNMGCPVPKITGGGGGSALLRDSIRASDCVSAMSEATSLPVTVKIRTGWNSPNEAPQVASDMENAGASALTVHGRTRTQKYSGKVEYAAIQQVVQAVSIPVIGNGDIVDLDSAKLMLATGASGIAVGRGALGRPWFFAELRSLFEGTPPPPPPSIPERMQILLELGKGVCALYGEQRGMKNMRRLAADFFKSSPGSALSRKKCSHLNTLKDLQALTEHFILQLESSRPNLAPER